MYEASKRYTEGKHAAGYLVSAGRTIAALGDKLGCGAGPIDVVLHLAAMRSAGTQVRAVDMQGSELASKWYLDIHLAEAKRQGWISSANGKLSVTSSGRQLVADLARGWERSARKLLAFSSALPFRKRAAKRTDDQA